MIEKPACEELEERVRELEKESGTRKRADEVLCYHNARKYESTTPKQGSRFLVRITVSGDENNALQDMV